MMGRTPDYLNVTFACFAGRSDVWARRDNEQGAANIVAYQREMRDRDLSTTHSIMNPQVDRTKPEAEQAAGEVALHKVGETENHITVRGARMLATLAPYADELTIYPGSDIRPQDGRYALSFAIPMGTPGLQVHLPRLLLEAARAVRLSALLPLRRDGRGGDLRRRRGTQGAGVPGRRHGRLLRGDHRHRLARPHHAPGLHPRLRQALVRLRARPPARQHHRRRPLRPHPGEARPDLEHGRADPVGAGVGRGRLVAGRGRRLVSRRSAVPGAAR